MGKDSSNWKSLGYTYLESSAWFSNETGTTIDVNISAKAYGSSDGPWGYGVYAKGTCYGDKGNTNIEAEIGKGWFNYKEVVINGTTTFTINKKTYSYDVDCWARVRGQTVNGYDGYGGSLDVKTTLTVPTITSYTVTYNASGGNLGAVPQKETGRYHGKTYTISSGIPSKENYTFLGWDISKTATKVVYKPGQSYTASKPLNLYAVWKIDSYTIIYEANYLNNQSPTSQKVDYNTKFSLPTFTTNKESEHKNLGWLMPNGNLVQGGSQFSWKKPLPNPIILYGIWESTLSFASKDSDISDIPESLTAKTFNSILSLPGQEPKRSGYIFSHWIDPKGIIYYPFSKIDINQNTTLEPVWYQVDFTPFTNKNELKFNSQREVSNIYIKTNNLLDSLYVNI